VRSRRVIVRAGVIALLLAAVVAAIVMPGVGKWAIAALLAGLASALSGLVSRGADKAIAGGRNALLAPPPPSAPLTVHAAQTPLGVRATQVGMVRGRIGPLPEGPSARADSRNWVALSGATVHLFVEATAERAVILRELRVRVESRSAAPGIDSIAPPLAPAPMAAQRLRTFEVDLSDPVPRPRPAADVPDFPYTVSHLDPERFILHARLSTPEDVTWRLEVHWLCNGESGVLVADLEGEPFRLVGPHARRSPR
jgi:hypothetical protein